MFTSKDLYNKNIYDVNGQKIGYPTEIYIDFYERKVIGLQMKNNTYIETQYILNLNEKILTTLFKKKEGEKLSLILGLKILDLQKNIKGILDDVIIDEDTYQIKGILVRNNKKFAQREVLLIKDCILYDDYMIYVGNDNIQVKNMDICINKSEYTKKA